MAETTETTGKPEPARHISFNAKTFGNFISIATKWLGKTQEAKNGLEVCIEKTSNQQMKLSVGAESAFLEASFLADVEYLTEPIFLDLSYLTSTDSFNVDKMQLVVPKKETGVIEKRAQFKAKGINFRIPFKTGSSWHRNKIDFAIFDTVPQLILEKDKFNQIYKYLDLPNSFSQPQPKTIILEYTANNLSAYTDDKFGALWHTFETVGAAKSQDLDKLTLLYDFLSPSVQQKEFKQLVLKQTQNLSFGEIMGSSVFESLRWCQPNYHKDITPIPQAIRNCRAKTAANFSMITKDFLAKLRQAQSFYRGDEIQKFPLDFSIVGSNYCLSAQLPHSEISVEGESQTPSSSPVKVKFQAKCLMDYIGCLDWKMPFTMEVFSSTVTLCQRNSDQNYSLIYWMPIHER